MDITALRFSLFHFFNLLYNTSKRTAKIRACEKLFNCLIVIDNKLKNLFCLVNSCAFYRLCAQAILKRIFFVFLLVQTCKHWSNRYWKGVINFYFLCFFRIIIVIKIGEIVSCCKERIDNVSRTLVSINDYYNISLWKPMSCKMYRPLDHRHH